MIVFRVFCVFRGFRHKKRPDFREIRSPAQCNASSRLPILVRRLTYPHAVNNFVDKIKQKAKSLENVVCKPSIVSDCYENNPRRPQSGLRFLYSVPTGYVSGWVRAYHLRRTIQRLRWFVNLFVQKFYSRSPLIQRQRPDYALTEAVLRFSFKNNILYNFSVFCGVSGFFPRKMLPKCPTEI